ncbi:Fic family protein [Nocardioides antri]|uniref:Fic family protein n=1 Tax=Nocardioides antri TaxID=2607659 RepID=A0A5B1M442_9ACTN|nr:Fic family protein [Nocardioides antri]KAA1426537.1 Fic family protein [Nocardioides antri]
MARPSPPGAGVPVPASTSARVSWQQTRKGGTIDDRRLREITVSVPADIAEIVPMIPAAIVALSEEAVRAMAALDATHGEHLRPLATLLLRAESIASSKIEHEEASIDDYVRALHGSRANPSALAMARATGALDRLTVGTVTEQVILDAHRRLMEHDPVDAPYAGRWRTMQNWIGGSDHSPRGAIYVPPPADQVPGKMADLVRFCSRVDLPAVAQAAIAHAQLEAIHPFTDGNGRIGRALAAGLLRQRGITRQVTVPVAAALAARRSEYFDALNRYHAGDAAAIVEVYASSATIAATESQTTAQRLREMPDRWREALGGPRAGTALAVVVDRLAQDPVASPEDLERQLRMPSTTVYRALERLQDAGIIRPLTDRRRNQVWGVGDVLDELADLAVRVEARVRGSEST